MKTMSDDPCTQIFAHLGEGFDLTLAYRWRRDLSPNGPDKSQFHWIGPNGLGFHKDAAPAVFKPAKAQKALSINAPPLRHKT